MLINELLDQTELSLTLKALQMYKLAQESEEANRKKQGWDTSNQSARIQQLNDIEEKLFEFID